jgi:two-component system, cell cycle sensor histidine kinase and response regulator CckA
MSTAATEQPPPFFRGRVGIVLIGLFGGVLSIAIAIYLHLTEQKLVQQEIERRAALRHDLLSQNLSRYDASLFALRLLAENSEDLTPAEFERAAAETINRVPGIHAIQWLAHLDAAELPAFVAHARAKISPGFSPSRRLPDGSVVPLDPEAPPPDRGEFGIISYVHPLPGNEITLGYDSLSGPTSGDLALAQERSGQSILTRAFHLVQGGEGIILSTYVSRARNPEAPAPVGGPGFLQIVLRLDAMLSRAWGISDHPVVDVLLVDATAESEVLLFARIGQTSLHSSLGAPPADFVNAQTHVRELPLGGRLWRAYYRPNAAWLAERRPIAPLFSLFGGGLLTLLSLVHLNTLRRQTRLVRKEVEQRTAELAESRALLVEIIDHNPSAIWVKDASLRFQLVNLAFAAENARSRSELIGLTDHDLHAPEVAETMNRHDEHVLRTGDTLSFEGSYDMPGSRRTYLVSKFPLRRSDGTIYAVAGIATDITELRAAEIRHLAVERKLLETQKLESLGILAGGVAHDFNNLLTGILGHASLARAQLSPVDPAQESLTRIETASHRAADLCRQMLAYAGRGRLSVQPIELGELARDTAKLLKLSLARRARLRFDLAPALPSVSADPVQMRQIIMNLVLNASESLVDGEGEITLSTRLVHADSALFASCVFAPELPAGNYIRLEVADTGQGMDAETLARIFDPFFSTKFTGRGLGLAAVLGIVRGHNGALQVTSQPGLGTTFRLYLPVVSAASDPESPAPANAKILAPSPTRPLRLLLIDDDEAIRETTPELLASRGHRVDAFSDGESGLRALAKEPTTYDAVILDLTMPGLGGSALLGQLRNLRPGLPVLLISGYASRECTGDGLLSQPRVAFLAKPFTLAEIQESLRRLLSPGATG